MKNSHKWKDNGTDEIGSEPTHLVLEMNAIGNFRFTLAINYQIR